MIFHLHVLRLPSMCLKSTFQLPLDHPPHAFISPSTCLHITLHMPSDHRPHAFRSPSTCLQITLHMPSDHPPHAFRSPSTCLQITFHMPSGHPPHAFRSLCVNHFRFRSLPDLRFLANCLIANVSAMLSLRSSNCASYRLPITR